MARYHNLKEQRKQREYLLRKQKEKVTMDKFRARVRVFFAQPDCADILVRQLEELGYTFEDAEEYKTHEVPHEHLVVKG